MAHSFELVDLSDRNQDVQGALTREGLVIFEGVASREQFLDLATTLGDVVAHRDSESDGATHIAVAGQQMVDGYLGFSNGALFPHTDRSSMREPPDLLLFWCETAAPTGGDSLFVDGLELFEKLQENHPAILEALCSEQSVVFRGEDGYLPGSVFSLAQDRAQIRFRLDRLGFFSSEVAASLPVLKVMIETLTQSVRLRDGEGYIVQNRRWLHGRRSFTGSRSCYRLLVNSRPHESQPPRFGLTGGGEA